MFYLLKLALFIEVNLRKCKWLLSGIYHPPSQSDQYFFGKLVIALDNALLGWCPAGPVLPHGEEVLPHGEEVPL